MRVASTLALMLAACGGAPSGTPTSAATTIAAADPSPAPSESAPKLPAPERLAADGPRTTVAGNTFVAPAGWSRSVRGPATVLEAPEAGSYVALVGVAANDADTALAAAWAAYEPSPRAPVQTSDVADKDGWTGRRAITYRTSP